MKTSTVCKLVAVLVILALGILSPLQAQSPEAQFQQGSDHEGNRILPHRDGIREDPFESE